MMGRFDLGEFDLLMLLDGLVGSSAGDLVVVLFILEGVRMDIEDPVEVEESSWWLARLKE